MVNLLIKFFLDCGVYWYSEIMACLQPYQVSDRGQKKANLHMCRESSMPAVLTENLFIDVAADGTKLKNEQVIQALITGHVKGIAKFLQLTPRWVQTPNHEVMIAVNRKQLTTGRVIDVLTWVPIRELCEGIGGHVSWDAKGNQVNIALS